MLFFLFCLFLTHPFLFGAAYSAGTINRPSLEYKHDKHQIFLLSRTVKDPINSLLLLNMAANRGSTAAMHELSLRLFYTFMDFERAKYWIRRAINPIPSDNIIPVALPRDISLFERLEFEEKDASMTQQYQEFFNDTFIRFKESLSTSDLPDISAFPPYLDLPTTPYLADSTLRPSSSVRLNK